MGIWIFSIYNRYTTTIIFMLAFLSSLLIWMPNSDAARRVALVIGNYEYLHAEELRNPQNDADGITTALEAIGFEVTTLSNQNYTQMRQSLLDFSEIAAGSEMALVYYAGHGIEVDKHNYLIPIDARLKTDRAVNFEALPLDLVTEAVSGTRKLSLVLLDACRNNPFAKTMKRTIAKRSIGRGLASVEPTAGTLISFAAKEGTVASDGVGNNSPYAKAIINLIARPGLEVDLLFRQVRDRVLDATGGQQEPYMYGSLPGKKIYLVPPVKTASLDVATTLRPSASTTSSAVDRNARDTALWNEVRDSKNIAMLEEYLRLMPNGNFAGIARLKIRNLEVVVKNPVISANGKAPAKLQGKIDFFNRKTGKAAAWFWHKPNGEMEFYDAPGFHPADGSQLKPVTLQIVRAYQTRLGQKAEDQIRQREVVLQQAKEKRLSGDNCDRAAGNRYDRNRNEAFQPVPYKLLVSQATSAIQACRKAVSQYPDSLRYQFQLARALQARKNRKEAESILGRLVSHSYPAAFDNLGWINLNKKRSNQAIPLFERGAQLGNPEAMLSLADQLWKGKLVKRNQPRAVALLQQAVSLGHEKARASLAIFQGQLQRQYARADRKKRKKMLGQAIIGQILRGVIGN